MSPRHRSPHAAKQARALLSGRLKGRRDEIAQAIFTRVTAVSGRNRPAGDDHRNSLRDAVFVALDFGFTAIECDEERTPPIPVPLLVQARVAARSGVSLDTLLRGYFAGHALLADFLVEEVETGVPLEHPALRRLLGAQAVLLDRLLAAVSEEHSRELSTHIKTPEQRRAERVQRLLNGELVDASRLAYDFDAFHLGAIASGPGAAEAIRELAASLDCRLLLVRDSEEIVWGWLGCNRRAGLGELGGVPSRWSARLNLAIGAPAQGLRGWRLTHKQAKVALPIAQETSQRFVRYADVALLASIRQDDLLATSLRELYLDPLDDERDGGETAQETLRAYFAADRNISSTAAILGISRPTVTSRLRAIEAKLGRPLGSATPEIDLALRLKDIGSAPPAPTARPSGAD